MQKFLKGGVAFAAAMMMTASFASAQMSSEGMYVAPGTSGEMQVFQGDKTEGVALLRGDAAANCPEGSYYESADHFVYPCGSTDMSARLGVMAPEQGAMMANGQPYPEGAMLLNSDGQAIGTDTDAADTTSGEDNAGEAQQQ